MTRIVLASGDDRDIAQSIGSLLDVDEIHGELTPQDKVGVILRERRRGSVMMVGDGVNDAPALAAADVGVALGVRGAAAAAEIADVVLLVDRLDRLADAIEIARRSRFIALCGLLWTVACGGNSTRKPAGECTTNADCAASPDVPI